jgi:uncharacterized membrane protein (UPF0127 family)
MTNFPVVGILWSCLAMSLYGASCAPKRAEELDKLGTVRLSIQGQSFELWIADDVSEQTQGLMFVTAERMSPLPDGTERGMIFAFDHEQVLNFWMRNTIIPLDIAYLDSDGVVVAMYTMAPLDERPGQYPSGSPAQYAIEVNAGVWGRIGLRPGDAIEIPSPVQKRFP